MKTCEYHWKRLKSLIGNPLFQIKNRLFTRDTRRNVTVHRSEHPGGDHPGSCLDDRDFLFNFFLICLSFFWDVFPFLHNQKIPWTIIHCYHTCIVYKLEWIRENVLGNMSIGLGEYLQSTSRSQKWHMKWIALLMVRVVNTFWILVVSWWTNILTAHVFENNDILVCGCLWGPDMQWIYTMKMRIKCVPVAVACVENECPCCTLRVTWSPDT